jgi:hypothetical protein
VKVFLVCGHAHERSWIVEAHTTKAGARERAVQLLRRRDQLHSDLIAHALKHRFLKPRPTWGQWNKGMEVIVAVARRDANDPMLEVDAKYDFVAVQLKGKP